MFLSSGPVERIWHENGEKDTFTDRKAPLGNDKTRKMVSLLSQRKKERNSNASCCNAVEQTTNNTTQHRIKGQQGSRLATVITITYERRL